MCETVSNTTVDRMNDGRYDAYRTRMHARFALNVASGDPLVTTDADLWDCYLQAWPDEQRQNFNCHACRDFIRKFGTLAMVRPDGSLYSPMWDIADAWPEYVDMVATMQECVAHARVTGVFYSSDAAWGRPITGPWTHYSIATPKGLIWKDRLRTAGQAMAEKREDFLTVMSALNDYSPHLLQQAVDLLQSEALYRSSHVIGPAKWLLELEQARSRAYRALKSNVVWRAVALAPAGFCHPRSSMIGTLLDDLAGGMAVADAARRFGAKMRPTQYQRPKAAPTGGNIAQAEKIVRTLGIEASLQRRFARLEEIQCLWKPIVAEDKGGGVFGHLKAKGAAPEPTGEAPLVTMTWEKFRRTVLANALEIQCRVASTDSYGALVTAVDPHAPPILQWDTEDARNPVSWYVYSNGSSARDWGIQSSPVTVSGIALLPMMWQDETAHAKHERGVMFVLQGAVDQRHAPVGLFPEILKSELREVRATIESFSRSKTLDGREEASACGLILQQGSTWQAVLRVRTKTGWFLYRLDRWD